MNTEKYEVIAKDFNDTLLWLDSLGIRLRNSRAEHYQKVLDHWSKSYSSASDDEAREVFPEFANTALEIGDFVEVYRSFGKLPAKQLYGLTEKMKKAVSGPVFYSAEIPKSITARNFLFEAAVSARCNRPDSGLMTNLNTKADCQLQFDGREVFIECKRLGSMAKIEANAKDASSQAEDHLSKSGANARAIVAFDITKLFDAGDKLYPYKNELELHRYISESMDGFIYKNSRTWESVYQRRNPRLIGTMLRFSHLAADEEKNMLITVNNWAINPRSGITDVDMDFLEKLTRSLNMV